MADSASRSPTSLTFELVSSTENRESDNQSETQNQVSQESPSSSTTTLFIDEDLEYLECPVCKEIPRAQIYNCFKGHSFCSDCWAQLDKCPLCESAITAARNFALEALIAIRKLPCPNKQFGCLEVIPGKHLDAHLRICAFKDYRYDCPLRGLHECQVQPMFLDDLHRHLMSVHSPNFVGLTRSVRTFRYCGAARNRNDVNSAATRPVELFLPDFIVAGAAGKFFAQAYVKNDALSVAIISFGRTVKRWVRVKISPPVSTESRTTMASNSIEWVHPIHFAPSVGSMLENGEALDALLKPTCTLMDLKHYSTISLDGSLKFRIDIEILQNNGMPLNAPSNSNRSAANNYTRTALVTPVSANSIFGSQPVTAPSHEGIFGGSVTANSIFGGQSVTAPAPPHGSILGGPSSFSFGFGTRTPNTAIDGVTFGSGSQSTGSSISRPPRPTRPAPSLLPGQASAFAPLNQVFSTAQTVAETPQSPSPFGQPTHPSEFSYGGQGHDSRAWPLGQSQSSNSTPQAFSMSGRTSSQSLRTVSSDPTTSVFSFGTPSQNSRTFESGSQTSNSVFGPSSSETWTFVNSNSGQTTTPIFSTSPPNSNSVGTNTTPNFRNPNVQRPQDGQPLPPNHSIESIHGLSFSGSNPNSNNVNYPLPRTPGETSIGSSNSSFPHFPAPQANTDHQ